MIEMTRKPDYTCKAEDGRTVNVYGTPSTEMFAEVFKRLIDKCLEEQAREIAANGK